MKSAKSSFRFFMPCLFLLLFIVSCAPPTTKVSMRVPGELNLKGVSKIAIIGFNTIDESAELGKFAADGSTLALAKGAVEDVFYREPCYSVVDLEVEKYIKRNMRNVKTPEQKFNALLYGKVWWQLGKEHRNILPSKVTLTEWGTEQKRCGEVSGKPIYCPHRYTLKTKEVVVEEKYRAVDATLMVSLSIYSTDLQDRSIKKITQTFEVAKREAIIKKGEFNVASEIVGFTENKDKLATLKAQETPMFGFISKSLGLQKEGKKVTGDLTVSEKLLTIPTSLEAKTVMLDSVIGQFNKAVAPHREDIPVLLKTNDRKITELILYSAYNSARKYIVETVLSGGSDKAAQVFYEDPSPEGFVEAATTAMKDRRKAVFEKEQAQKAEKDRQAYKEPDAKKLQEEVEKFLKDNIDYFYSYALAEEAIGNYTRALSIWRFAFGYRPTTQEFADGIGRCMLALDYNSKLKEEIDNKKTAAKITE